MIPMQLTLDILKVHPRVMRDLRGRGLSEAEIAEMTPEQAFNAFCQYNGFAGNWGQTLASILDSLRASVVAPSVAEVIADPAVSDWTKRSLRSALLRDPVDAAADAELVSSVLAAHAEQQLRIDRV